MTEPSPNLRLWFFHKRFIFLFIALLIPYFIHPMISTEVLGFSILDISFSLLLVAGILAVSSRKHVAYTALAIVIVSQILTWTSHAVSNPDLILAGMAVNTFYLSYMAIILLIHTIQSKTVTSNTIFAALCVYLLIGFIWAFMYAGLEVVNAHSFQINPHLFAEPPAGVHLYSELYYFIYYSFTTLTTLGFGDIMPASPWSRVLSSLEAIVGQLYLVVMVSRLVGLQITQSVNMTRK